MNGLPNVEGVIILGLVLMCVAVCSALRGLYIRSNIPFLARDAKGKTSPPQATVTLSTAKSAPRKAA
ncbi:MAG TPA: hypothetical protein VHV77_07945 [Pirellulales bacterium]|jgi:hypothetical protein|nr:hypothetical protein [Pirellulales bacterium]